MKVRKRLLVGIAALLVAGCGSPGPPVDPAPVGSVERPEPANATVETNVEGGGSTDDSCDPTVSLAPDPSIPSGSTMDAIRKRGVLRVGVDQNTYLFGFRNPTNGQLEGFDIDVARFIANDLLGDPDKVQFKAITSAKRIPALQNGEVDIVVRTFSVTCDRLKEVNFSSIYYEAGQRVLVKSNSPVQSIRDLGGRKVCAAKKSTSLQNIANARPRPVPVSVDDWTDCLVMLQQGQVAAVSTDDTILAGMAKQDPTTKIVGERFTDELYGVGIPKQNGDLVRYVNAVLEKFRKGPWRESYDRWLLESLGQANPPSPKYQ